MVGGRDSNDAPLYITRVKYDGGVHVAKAGEHLSGAHLAFGDKEVIVHVSNKLIVWPARSVLTYSYRSTKYCVAK